LLVIMLFVVPRFKAMLWTRLSLAAIHGRDHRGVGLAQRAPVGLGGCRRVRRCDVVVRRLPARRRLGLRELAAPDCRNLVRTDLAICPAVRLVRC
jgi:hypothetical protein